LGAGFGVAVNYFEIMPDDWANAVWADPVSAPPWMPLSAYAADGKPATCSKEPAVQWVWGAVQEDVGILYGPDIAVDAFRFPYRKSDGLEPLFTY
jgi:hypothetical protein